MMKVRIKNSFFGEDDNIYKDKTILSERIQSRALSIRKKKIYEQLMIHRLQAQNVKLNNIHFNNVDEVYSHYLSLESNQKNNFLLSVLLSPDKEIILDLFDKDRNIIKFLSQNEIAINYISDNFQKEKNDKNFLLIIANILTETPIINTLYNKIDFTSIVNNLYTNIKANDNIYYFIMFTFAFTFNMNSELLYQYKELLYKSFEIIKSKMFNEESIADIYDILLIFSTCENCKEIFKENLIIFTVPNNRSITFQLYQILSNLSLYSLCEFYPVIISFSSIILNQIASLSQYEIDIVFKALTNITSNQKLTHLLLANIQNLISIVLSIDFSDSVNVIYNILSCGNNAHVFFLKNNLHLKLISYLNSNNNITTEFSNTCIDLLDMIIEKGGERLRNYTLIDMENNNAVNVLEKLYNKDSKSKAKKMLDKYWRKNDVFDLLYKA